jgi:prevent-host-death family protein
MQTVGVKELKENLSRYLKKVRSGERIVVTDRKKEVAVIVPSPMEAEEEQLLQLIQRGVVYWSGSKVVGMPARLCSKGGAVSNAVLEDRR